MKTSPILSATRPIEPGLAAKLLALQPGQKVKLTQTVRVGQKSWPAVVEGTYRHWNYLATGLATDRVKQDDIAVVMVHFTKPNGEMSSIALDERTQLEVLGT